MLSSHFVSFRVEFKILAPNLIWVVNMVPYNLHRENLIHKTWSLNSRKPSYFGWKHTPQVITHTLCPCLVPQHEASLNFLILIINGFGNLRKLHMVVLSRINNRLRESNSLWKTWKIVVFTHWAYSGQCAQTTSRKSSYN